LREGWQWKAHSRAVGPSAKKQSGSLLSRWSQMAHWLAARTCSEQPDSGGACGTGGRPKKKNKEQRPQRCTIKEKIEIKNPAANDKRDFSILKLKKSCFLQRSGLVSFILKD